MRTAFVSIGTGKFFLSPAQPGDPLLPVIPPAPPRSLYSARTFPPRRFEGHGCQTVDPPPRTSPPRREKAPSLGPKNAGEAATVFPRCRLRRTQMPALFLPGVAAAPGSAPPSGARLGAAAQAPRGWALRGLRLVPGPPPRHRGGGGQGCGGARSRAKQRGSSPWSPRTWAGAELTGV